MDQRTHQEVDHADDDAGGHTGDGDGAAGVLDLIADEAHIVVT